MWRLLSGLQARRPDFSAARLTVLQTEGARTDPRTRARLWIVHEVGLSIILFA